MRCSGKVHLELERGTPGLCDRYRLAAAVAARYPILVRRGSFNSLFHVDSNALMIGESDDLGANTLQRRHLSSEGSPVKK